MAISHHQLRKLSLADAVERTDAQLLESFVSHRETAALETLVLRHGPMVWGACCRLLNHHDAEDAFQATFLILIRKAASIVPREMVGNWLYGVAHQAALNARTRIARLRVREVQVTEMPEPAVTERDLWPDLQPLLDQELSRLPNKYRVTIVLCDLEGKTRKEAARQLNLPEGTVASRLARARTMLANRLARHGLAVSGGMLEVVLSQKASGTPPPSVMSSTIETVTRVAAGQAMAGVISVQVANLTEGVLKTMFLTKLKTAIAVLLVTVVVVAGAVAVGLSALGDDKPQPAKMDQPAPQEAKLPQVPQQAGDSTKLLKTKLDAAKKAHGEAMQNLAMVRRMGNIVLPVGKPDEVYTWSVRWLNAQREMSDKRDEHIAALEEHIKRMKELQKRVDAMTPSIFPSIVATASEWYLAEAELWLVKEKAK